MMAKRHPNSGDLYTPVTPQLLALFERMKAEKGSYRYVCAITGTRMKVFRNLRRGRRKAISQRLLDRLCTGTRVGSIREFTWFTADDLVALGIWEQVHFVDGIKSTKRWQEKHKEQEQKDEGGKEEED